MSFWGGQCLDYQRRVDTQQLEAVRQHWERFRWTAQPCKWSALPRAYCGGCFHGQHTLDPVRYG